MCQLSKEDSLNELVTLLTNEINELSDTLKKYQFAAERDRKDFESKEEAPIDLIMFSKKMNMLFLLLMVQKKLYLVQMDFIKMTLSTGLTKTAV